MGATIPMIIEISYGRHLQKVAADACTGCVALLVNRHWKSTFRSCIVDCIIHESFCWRMSGSSICSSSWSGKCFVRCNVHVMCSSAFLEVDTNYHEGLVELTTYNWDRYTKYNWADL